MLWVGVWERKKEAERRIEIKEMFGKSSKNQTNLSLHFFLKSIIISRGEQKSLNLKTKCINDELS